MEYRAKWIGPLFVSIFVTLLNIVKSNSDASCVARNTRKICVKNPFQKIQRTPTLCNCGVEHDIKDVRTTQSKSMASLTLLQIYENREFKNGFLRFTEIQKLKWE